MAGGRAGASSRRRRPQICRTRIVTPPHDGTYLDGAWGGNPPINELLDYDLREIWVIQHFPKAISEPPHAPAERKERKDELWQNSLVEHEVESRSLA